MPSGQASGGLAVARSLLLAWLVLSAVHPGRTLTTAAQPPPPTQHNLTVGIILSNRTLMEQVVYPRLQELNQEAFAARRPKVLISLIHDLPDRPTRSANPIEAVLSVCERFVQNGVGALLLSNENQDLMTAVSISYTLGFYHIPLLSVDERDNIFSDKSIHRTFLRTVPGYAEQAELMAQLVQHYGWNKVAVVAANDINGRQFLNTLWPAIDRANIVVEPYYKYSPGNALNIQFALHRLTMSPTRVVLVYASQQDAIVLCDLITARNLTSGFVWVFNDLLLSAPFTRPMPTGLIATKLRHEDDLAAHLSDALLVIKRGYQSLVRSLSDGGGGGHHPVHPTPTQCGGQETYWASGAAYLREMKRFKENPAETGDVAFNEDSGDRINSEYVVMNVQGSTVREIGVWDREGYRATSQTVVWPGGQSAKPQGIVVSKHLRIVTAVTEPFVNKVPALRPGECTHLLAGLDIPQDAQVVPCDLPPHLSRNATEHYCCYGYCIDLLVKLTGKLNITYDLHLVADGKFGTRNLVTENGGGDQWDGSIGEIISKRADMIVAALTIDNERAQVIDFSNPFKHQGLSIVVKKKQPNSSLASFIQPFQYQLWILIALSVHVVALILYLLDRFSPFGRFKIKQHQGNEEEDALNLSSAMWFAWGVLLNSGIGEGTPRSFSARVLGVVWAGFAMIIVASYTANLAAFLVLDRPEAEIAGINDARMRNPSEAYKYGTVKDSAVQAYFKRKVEMSNMYRFMLRYSKHSAQEAIEDVKTGELDAFIWDSAVLDYETSRDCNLVTVGEMFHRSGYGIGMAKGSAWKEKISLEILQFHEDGFMETLDNKWMKVGLCDNSDTQPATLGLENMAGVFMLVGGGIVAGIVLIFIEMSYKRHYGKQEQQEIVARAAFDKWRSNIKKKKRAAAADVAAGRHGIEDAAESLFEPVTPGESLVGGGGGYGSEQAGADRRGWNQAKRGGPPTIPDSLLGGGGCCSYIPLRQVANHSGDGGGLPFSTPTASSYPENRNGPVNYYRCVPSPAPTHGGNGWLPSSQGSRAPAATGSQQVSSEVSPQLQAGNTSPSSSSSRSAKLSSCGRKPVSGANQTHADTADLKLFDPDFVRERSSAGRASAKSSRGDLHLT